jgi:regulation of enolase protein 1 (concanavalin A-like superfamily)
MSDKRVGIVAALCAVVAGVAVYLQLARRKKRSADATAEADAERTHDAVSAPIATDDDFLQLKDPFSISTLPSSLTWFCPPSSSTGSFLVQPSMKSLTIRTDAQTDFWQRTHYGFRVDNGHCLMAHLAGDFVVQARIRAHPQHQYDQAGLVVRGAGSSCWLKTSVEFEPEEPSRLGAVVTNFGYSDWSTQEFEPALTITKRASSSNSSSTGSGPAPIDYWLRIRREEDDYIVDSSLDGMAWTQLRMAHLHQSRGKPVQAGLYACSPKENGFEAVFSQFSIRRGRIAKSTTV